MFEVVSKPKVNELKMMKLFTGVSEETLGQIVDSFVVRRLKKGEVLLVPNQPNHYLYLVLSGKLSVFLDASFDEPVCSFGPGEPIGELSVIDKNTTSAYVVTETKCRLLVLDETQVWSLVEESHAFSRNLLTSISTRLRNTNQMISSKSREDDTFYDYGMLDVLTGMHSRRWFDRIINRALRRSILDGKPFSILIADIDNFNSYNEQYGRMCGDLALNRIAHTIQEHLRVTELAVRYEGDRLMVLLPGTDIRKARKVAERLRLKVMYTDMPAPGGRMLHPLTISVGIAQATPEQTVDEFMDNVLTALKRAKDMGRNYVSE